MYSQMQNPYGGPLFSPLQSALQRKCKACWKVGSSIELFKSLNSSGLIGFSEKATLEGTGISISHNMLHIAVFKCSYVVIRS